MRAISRAIDLIELLIYSPEGKRLSELAEDTGLSKATVLRLLAALHEAGIAERDEADRRYRLAPRGALAAAAVAARSHGSVHDGISRLLVGLAEVTGATAVLLPCPPSPRTRGLVAAAFELPRGPLRIEPRRDISPRAHVLAAGKCYLAGLSPERLEEWLQGGLPPETSHTIISVEALCRELAEVRARGYATEREEHLLGTFGLAVPVSAAEGRGPFCFLELVAPDRALVEENLPHCLHSLRDAAGQVARLCRFSPPASLLADTAPPGRLL